jgi:hypothetical protein
MLACFVPEREFNSIPKPELIVDSAQVVLDHMLCGSDGFSDFSVCESLGNEFNDSEFSFIGREITVHNCLSSKSLRGSAARIEEIELNRTYCKGSLGGSVGK